MAHRLILFVFFLSVFCGTADAEKLLSVKNTSLCDLPREIYVGESLPVRNINGYQLVKLRFVNDSGVAWAKRETVALFHVENGKCRHDRSKYGNSILVAYIEIKNLNPNRKETVELNCFARGNSRGDHYVGVVRLSKGTDTAVSPIRAWRVDVVNDTFEKVGVDNVRCDVDAT